MKKEKGTSKGAGLRSRAEERLKRDKKMAAPMLPEADTRRMVHELQVHQIELELQNEELKQAREELERQLEKYSDLYNFAPVGYFTLDSDGTIREANLTGAKLLGVERSRLVGRRFGSFLRHESRQAFDGCLRGIYGGAAVESCEAALLTAGEIPRYVQIEGAPVDANGGAAGQCRVAMIDITRRWLAEEALRRYELLSHHSRDIVLLMRYDDGSILEANAAAEHAYGYCRDELLNLAIHDLRAVPTRGLTAGQMAQADAGGILFETVHRRKDGSTFPVEVSSQGATINGTRTLISVVRDISRRKQAEEALQRSEQRYRLLFEHMLDGFAYCRMVFDDQARPIDFVYLEVNAAFVRLTGLKNVAGRKVTEVIPGIREAHPELLEIYGRVASTGRPERFEIEFTPLGRWFSVSVYSTERDHFVAVFDDITGRKQAEEALKEANSRLIEAKEEVDRIVEARTSELTRAYESLRVETEERQRAEVRLRQAHKMEAIGTLAGGIAHDFNNILAAIIGFSEMARDKIPEGSPARRHVERIFTAGMRGRDLVRQILTFSRQGEQTKQPLRLGGVVRETLRLLRASLPRTIEIRMNLRSESGFVLADPTQMQQIVMNLCTNAAHAIRRTGGSISIDLAPFSFASPEDAPDPVMKSGTYARLSVIDTGEGMSPEILDHVFDPFFTTKAAGQGTGLGLSVVHGIVASHGGAITVVSEPGRGSTFTVYLPKLLEEHARDSGEGDGPAPRGRERILFVDDEADLAAMADEMLADLGYQVTSRTAAREALALFRLDPSQFDLVITDQAMPEMTGQELVREILALRPDTPVIMCTGFSPLVDADSAEAAGVRAFALKPLTKTEIAAAIRRVLDR